MFFLRNPILIAEKQMCTNAALNKEVSVVMKLADFFRSRSNFFIKISPQNFSTKTQIWIFAPQQPEFFLALFEKSIFFTTKSRLSVAMDIQKTVSARVTYKFTLTVWKINRNHIFLDVDIFKAAFTSKTEIFTLSVQVFFVHFWSKIYYEFVECSCNGLF